TQGSGKRKDVNVAFQNDITPSRSTVNGDKSTAATTTVTTTSSVTPTSKRAKELEKLLSQLHKEVDKDDAELRGLEDELAESPYINWDFKENEADTMLQTCKKVIRYFEILQRLENDIDARNSQVMAIVEAQRRARTTLLGTRSPSAHRLAGPQEQQTHSRIGQRGQSATQRYNSRNMQESELADDELTHRSRGKGVSGEEGDDEQDGDDD
ncbi:hypothetical protein KEM55_003285, partial [Ascosphaera atra]